MTKISKITFVSIIFIMTQLFISSLLTGSYATPDNGQSGKLFPKGQVDPNHLQPPKILGTPDSVPLRTPGGMGMSNKAQGPDEGAAANILQSTTISKQSGFGGLGYDLLTPPDVQVAAGTVNVMEMTNIQGGIWSKTGTPQGTNPFSLTDFFGTGSDSLTDPKVLFDASSSHWFASISDTTSGQVIVAVSKTSDATQGFWLYQINGTGTAILDQPIIGVSDDKFVVSTNNFDPNFTGAQYWILDKSALIQHKPVSFYTTTTNSYYSIHPVQSLSPTQTLYMVSTLITKTGPFVYLFSVTGNPSTNNVSVSVKSFSSAFTTPHIADQPGTTFNLDTGDYRVQDAAWASGTLWLGNNNSCTPSGDSKSRSCIHLVAIDTSSMQVKQDFNYGLAGKYLYYPALRSLPNGKLFVVYGLSSSVDYPSIMVAETTGISSTMSSATTLVQGKAPVTLSFGCSARVCRYGDYFGAGLDPSVSNGVWVAGEFGSGVTDRYGYQWATQIGNFIG